MPSARFSLARLRDKILMRIWQTRSSGLSGARYWEERARLFGSRAVLNLSHSSSEIDRVTEMQKREILPFVTKLLRGDELHVLDFGCGPGRFTTALLQHSRGTVIAADPVRSLLLKVPREPRVACLQIQGGTLPLASDSVDVVWVCLVLGGIPSDAIGTIARELQRVLKKGGTLILVENTTEAKSSAHWHFRTKSEYQSLFDTVSLTCLNEYTDAKELISVMAGNRDRS